MDNVELGQTIFWGNRVKRYECPEYLTALLREIDNRLCMLMWNVNQEEYSSPFNNSGNVDGFKNDVFEAHAFSWDDDFEQLFNFRCGDFEVSWYKYLGRGMTMNKEITPEEAVMIFDKCIKSLELMDK